MMDELMIYFFGMLGTFIGTIIILKFGKGDLEPDDDLFPILFITACWPVMIPFCVILLFGFELHEICFRNRYR